MSRGFVGIDIGATWLRVAITNSNGEVLDKKRVRTPDDGDELVDLLIRTIREIVVSNGVDDIVSIGIGSIGPINIVEGLIVNTPNLKIGTVNVVKPLFEEFERSVYFVNDCTAGVLGEKIFGAGKDYRNLVYITLSSGIGGGAIVDGNLLFGKDGNAVEIGHFVVDWEGRLECGCGGFGHWEAYASGANIPKFVKLLLNDENFSDFSESILYEMINGDLNKLEAKHIFDAAKKGDKFSLKIVKRIGLINSIGFANVINAYDPDLITVGGGIALNNPDLVLPYIKENLKKFTINRIPDVIITPLGDDIVLYGAIAIAMNPEYIPEEFRRFEIK